MKRVGDFSPTTSLPAPQDKPSTASAKKLYRLVDTGIGGGLTTATERGAVQQLGAYNCIPIGQKPKQQAIAYTAGLALWPMIAPLKNKQGQYDGTVSEHVVVACNSASVRKEGALPLMKDFCQKVHENRDQHDLPPDIKDNICDLHKEVEANPNYFDERFHEIVSPTARAAADAASDALTREGNPQDSYFIRVDSTNGTAESQSYLHKIPAEMERKLSPLGYTMEEVHNDVEKVHVGKDEYAVTHAIVEFKAEGKPTKTLYIEGRGNPPWVPAIENGTYRETGPTLVRNSCEASKIAADKMNEERAAVFRSSPDLSMMCCTHYPPMEQFLADQYKSDGRKTAFLNQAVVVNGIIDELKAKYPGDPRVISDGEMDDLDLVITIGSQNAGGVTVPIDKAKGIRSDIPKSVENTKEKEETISGIIGTMRAAAGINTPAHVTIHTQDEVGGLQDQFECMQRFLGLCNADKIMEEQGYTGEYEVTNRGAISKWLSFEAIDSNETPWGPPKEPKLGQEKIPLIPEEARASIQGLAKIITTGEPRGVDKFAIRVNVGNQLLAASAQLKSMIDDNKKLPIGERQRVGILTGFTVIDNATGESKGGENDGPPGAAIMAKTFLNQGTPVTLVTDASAEPPLLNTLEALGLATFNGGDVPPNERRMSNYKLMEGLEIEVAVRPALIEATARYDLQDDQDIVAGVRDRLRDSNVGTMISIERPSVTNDGRLFSMLAKDISQHNMDMHALLVKADGWTPFTIGIGDGGNELGTGQASRLVGEMRAPNLELFVGRGTAIAASSEFQTDAMILASVSNTGGIALSMATLAALGEAEGRLVETAEDYARIIDALFEKGLSIDGVNKVNALTVDGRPMGRLDDEPHAVTMNGSVDGRINDATHADMMKEMLSCFNVSLTPAAPAPVGEMTVDA